MVENAGVETSGVNEYGKRRDRGTEGVEGQMCGEKVSPSQPTRGSVHSFTSLSEREVGERRKLPQRGSGESPVKN